MKRDTRDKVHHVYTVIAGWVTVAGVLLVFAAVFSQWRVGLDQFNLVWQTLTDAIMDREGLEGDLPVTFKVCDAGHTDCVVAARFMDMQSCQSHLKLSSMLCDSKSDPRKITCREQAASQSTTAICDQ
jgi:hypothetical protein